MATAQLSTQQQALLDWLVQLADQNKPCPTGREIAAKFGLSSDGGASMLLSGLEAAGSIFVERKANWRIVTILASGKELRSAGAPAADRLPATIGRPDLGHGEKRKPAELVVGKVAVGRAISGAAPIDHASVVEEPGASPDGEASDITIGADTIVARGVDEGSPPLNQEKADEHAHDVGSAPLGRLPDDQGDERSGPADPPVGGAVDREGDDDRPDDRDGSERRPMDAGVTDWPDAPGPTPPEHSTPSTCARPATDRFADQPVFAERTLRILENAGAGVDLDLICQIYSLVLDAGAVMARRAVEDRCPF